jgi:hypothetical protein
MAGAVVLAAALAAAFLVGCGSGGASAPSGEAVARGLAADWPACVEAAFCPGGDVRAATCASAEPEGGTGGRAFDCLVEGGAGDVSIVRVVCDGETCRWEPPSSPGDTGLPGDAVPPYEGSFPLAQ